MFEWLFPPTCPCDPAAKKWLEEKLRWLSQQFGLHILLERPIIVPTAEFFPDKWEPSPEGARVLFRRVCEHMHVDPDSIELEFYDHNTPAPLAQEFGYAAGTWFDNDQPWRGADIRIERGSLDRPSDLIGTMAHELAHQRLLGERRYHSDRFDNELLTDLTAVFHGFGVFLANNPRHSTGELSYWPGTKLYKPEYLSEPMFGYAMAHIAWIGDDSNPAWAKHLRWAPRAVFKEGLRFLEKTGESSFKPVRFRIVDIED